MVGERVKDKIDREPFWRNLDDKYKDQIHEMRNKPGEHISGKIPRFKHRNFGAGIGLGITEAGVATVLADVVGVPFGADADVSQTAETSEGLIYTVDVNAPTKNMAEARAFIDSGTGFTTILTEALNVQSTEIIKTRTLRDTYRVKILVKE